MREKEMNDFIKWLVDYADGFEIYEDVIYRSVKSWNQGYFINNYKNSEDYPLLLQKAIEGLNKYNINIEIMMDSIYIKCWVKSYLTKFSFFYYLNVDDAKEVALKYIWEATK